MVAAVKAGKALIDAFERGADLPVSKTKGKVMASNSNLAAKIVDRLNKHGYKAVRPATILGVDTAVGRAGVHKPMRNRMTAVEKRKQRFARLKRMGGEHKAPAQCSCQAEGGVRGQGHWYAAQHQAQAP